MFVGIYSHLTPWRDLRKSFMALLDHDSWWAASARWLFRVYSEWRANSTQWLTKSDQYYHGSARYICKGFSIALPESSFQNQLFASCCSRCTSVQMAVVYDFDKSDSYDYNNTKKQQQHCAAYQVNTTSSSVVTIANKKSKEHKKKYSNN